MPDLPDFGLGTVVSIGIFLGVLLLFEGLRQLLSRGEDASGARNRRMKMIAAGASAEQVLSLLKPRAGQWALHQVPFIGALPAEMRRAGITIRPAVFLTGSLALAAVIALAGSLRFGILPGLGAGLLLGLALPLAVVAEMRRRRIDLLTRQLPDALDLMARGLKVGHPLNATIGTVAHDMSDPVASEFGVMVDQIAYGDDIVAAFADLAERVGTEDARYLATSVAIQNGTGGDLSRVLMTLAKVIRGRIMLRRRIMAISSEGRLTALFLSAMPFLIFTASSLSNPSYYWDVADDPLFRPMAYTVVGLVVANYLIMRRLVNFKV
jgi:tight adherence protein B